ncbi:MAG: ribonuclease R [Bacteroidetes bacterium RIFCSPLOWO2_02_FULL_36_8]|nr:MAG: ribonuclease R [Bacteroidetes bacterium RIFCSPLOWO2_02_FULL_36_8]OFY70383.1 MAG: ribonuclease R [Bacteroidetes bacterium RIFCSPLOWO2_12_FULL_37_12]
MKKPHSGQSHFRSQSRRTNQPGVSRKTSKFSLEGKIDMTAFGDAYLVSENFHEDVFIPGKCLSNALHKDFVQVEVRSRDHRGRHVGMVTKIIKRSQTEFPGAVELHADFAIITTDQKKQSFQIRVPIKLSMGAVNGQKVLCRITRFPDPGELAEGKVVKIFGKSGEHNTEMQSILYNYGFPPVFPKEVEDESKHIPDIIPDSEINKRRDFRKTPTFTIDPEDAKDFDDALSLRKISDNRWEVGVHIADASHYIRSGTALDKEAFHRATSVYLVDRTVPMLPEKLSNHLCSLVPNEDRLTFSVVFEMDENAVVHKSWFGKTVIRSAKRYSYEEAQKTLDTNQGVFMKELSVLNRMAEKLRSERFKNCAIDFETQEVKFRLDSEGKPLELLVKERKSTHLLVEEFMLLANRAVAEEVGKTNKNNLMIYRVHDSPDREKLRNFARFAEQFGYFISFNDRNRISKTLNQLRQDSSGKPEAGVLQQLAIRTMAKAIYDTEPIGHYGLAFDYYSHFTSPIRRYPDIIAHRILFNHLKNKPIPLKKAELKKMCHHCSLQEKEAMDAERDSVKYKQVEYMKNFIGKIYQGVVSGIAEKGLYIEIPETHCEGFLRLSELKDDFYFSMKEKYQVVGRRWGKVIRLGDAVSVIVKSANVALRAIELSKV